MYMNVHVFSQTSPGVCVQSILKGFEVLSLELLAVGGWRICVQSMEKVGM
jgi:hypothetical protein